MTLLVDTDMLIDIRRGAPAAVAWLEANLDDAFDVPVIVVLELLSGCRNRAELRATRAFLSSLPVVCPTPGEFALAVELFDQYSLANGLGSADCLIAAMALARDARLLTFNLRHFGVVAGLEAARPYVRG